MIDEAFFMPRQSVSIVSIGDSGEALLVRAILESLGAVATLHLPGTPSDFLRFLAQPEQAPAYLVICVHGTEEGIVFGEYGPGIDTTMLVHGCLPPGDAFLTLDPSDKDTILGMKAYQYDIVCNGVELSSGAIRNHRPDTMKKAFALAGYDESVLEERFGGMYRAFQYGAPPHGGIAVVEVKDEG